MDLPEVAIPTYQRADILLTHTLPYLLSQNYPAEKITIFVASEQECETYKNKLPVGSYKELVVGMPGLLNQRRVISEHYKPGQIILQMDDDVKGLKILRANQTFLDLIRWGCWLMESKQCGLFGVMPTDDARRFSEDLTSHLAHIVGSFFLCVNTKDCIPNIQEKEDYERTILYFKKYGSVLRWNGAGVSTRYMETPGGLQQPGRPERMASEVRYLIETYPDYCKERTKKNTADILLNWRAKALPKIISEI